MLILFEYDERNNTKARWDMHLPYINLAEDEETSNRNFTNIYLFDNKSDSFTTTSYFLSNFKSNSNTKIGNMFAPQVLGAHLATVPPGWGQFSTSSPG